VSRVHKLHYTGQVLDWAVAPGGSTSVHRFSRRSGSSCTHALGFEG